VWYGHQWWTVWRFMESTDDAYVGGEVTAIAPKIAGFIAEVAVTDNPSVHAGDLLIKIDDRDYRAGLAKARAGVAAPHATLANLDAARALQQSMIAQAEAEVAAGDAEVTRSQFDVVRYQHLASDQYASMQRLQQADADSKKAVSAAAKARAALAAAQRKLDVIDTQKQQAEAALAAAVAECDLAQLNLGYTELRAPIDGVVGNRSARVGAYANGRRPTDLVGAGTRTLGRRQFQGEPARAHPARIAGHRRGGCATRAGLSWAGRQSRTGDRGPVQRSAARERNRQFH